MKYLVHKSLMNPEGIKRIIELNGDPGDGIIVNVNVAKQITIYEPNNIEISNIFGDITDDYAEIEDFGTLINEMQDIQSVQARH